MYMWAYAMCLYSVRCKRDDSDYCKTRTRNICVYCALSPANKLSAKRARSAEAAAILIYPRSSQADCEFVNFCLTCEGA